MKQTVNIGETINLLNELVALDESTVRKLIQHRVKCNDDLANHPTVQVSSEKGVGMLGILNGLFGVDDDGWGPITMVTEKNKKIVEFRHTQEEE